MLELCHEPAHDYAANCRGRGWHWRENYARLHDGTLDEMYERRQATLTGGAT